MASSEMALGGAETALGASSGEAVLMQHCRQGDPHAFARLVALHEGMVFGLAARMLGDPEEAKDLAQEVFLQVYRQLGRFEGRSSLKTWIYRIVVNQCRNRQRWWRRRRRDRSSPIEDMTPAEEATLVDGTAGPHEALERRESARRVQAALTKLSFDHRAILLLREVEGLPVEAVASSLGVAEGTVKSRLARAREALRQAVLREGVV